MSPLAALLLLAAHDGPKIDDFVQPRLHDASFTARVEKGDQNELAKINKDFGQAYRFQFTNVKVKEPFKLRLETNVEDTEITYVINGARQMYWIPKARIHISKDFSSEPGRRQSALDFGLLTPSLFESLFDAAFVRQDRATGGYVFDITYKKDDTSRSRVWVDPEKHYVFKREWYNQVGRQLATFLYERPREVGGVWLPTRLTVRNTDNKVAGITHYEGVKVNTGLADSLFQIR